MRNPIKNAWNALLHDRRHVVFAILRRMPWIIPNDKLYIKIFYRLSMRKKLNLDNPTTFNEKLQWLKLYDRKPEYTTMVDKYLVKEYVKQKIGEQYVIPTIGVWDTPADIDWDVLPNQFVLKTNHDGGGNGVVICKDKTRLNKSKALRELNHSYYRSSYLIGREWPYKNVKHKIFAEQFMEDSQCQELRDYKFYCFDGEVKVMLIAACRASGKTGMNYYDMDFNYLDFHQGHPHIPFAVDCPKSFLEMKELVSKLSKGLPQCRIDMYEVDGHPYFGEFTFFDAGGVGAFVPEEWDKIFGNWIKLPEVSK